MMGTYIARTLDTLVGQYITIHFSSGKSAQIGKLLGYMRDMQGIPVTLDVEHAQSDVQLLINWTHVEMVAFAPQEEAKDYA
jgi:hypothetical protein